ncbi:MAG: class I SAM-dependent methyltransferase, partial [Deltaproteobacteria bacterium]|nr:class I SAM-dependent methyltransferase [Deltaproteobacteria bacterium]
SHQTQTAQDVRALFEKQGLDFAFIDGDHTYEGVTSDFLNYGPLVRPGGIIVFHDILPCPELPEIQVFRFWREVREKYNTKEIIGPEGSGKRVGIGLIHVDEKFVPTIHEEIIDKQLNS